MVISKYILPSWLWLSYQVICWRLFFNPRFTSCLGPVPICSFTLFNPTTDHFYSLFTLTILLSLEFKYSFFMLYYIMWNRTIPLIAWISIYSHFTVEENHIHTSFPFLEHSRNLLPNSTSELFKVSLLNI